MTLRRFNYTGRKKIHHLRIRISQSEKKILDLHIPHDALTPFDAEDILWLEARRAGTLDSKRFPLGTVGAPSSASGLDYSSLACSDPTFVLKVVDARRAGRLSGVSADITVELGDVSGGRSILPLNVDDELKDRAWQLKFDATGPVLNVSGNIPNARDYAVNTTFTALVLPDVFRQVLHRLLIEDKIFETDDMDDWHTKWLLCALDIRADHALPREPEQDDDEGWDAVKVWIDETVTAFEEKKGLFGRLVSELREVEE